MFAELLLAAILVAGKHEQIEKDDRYVTDRITSYVTRQQGSRQARCAISIAYKESRFQQYATNGKYWGIFQLGFAHSNNWTIKRQLHLAHRYVEHRYGNWCNAWLHHIDKNWY
jgi:hypothetical protein